MEESVDRRIETNGRIKSKRKVYGHTHAHCTTHTKIIMKSIPMHGKL